MIKNLLLDKDEVAAPSIPLQSESLSSSLMHNTSENISSLQEASCGGNSRECVLRDNDKGVVIGNSPQSESLGDITSENISFLQESPLECVLLDNDKEVVAIGNSPKSESLSTSHLIHLTSENASSTTSLRESPCWEDSRECLLIDKDKKAALVGTSSQSELWGSDLDENLLIKGKATANDDGTIRNHVMSKMEDQATNKISNSHYILRKEISENVESNQDLKVTIDCGDHQLESYQNLGVTSVCHASTEMSSSSSSLSSRSLSSTPSSSSSSSCSSSSSSSSASSCGEQNEDDDSISSTDKSENGSTVSNNKLQQID